jgi:hypothetical protein
MERGIAGKWPRACCAQRTEAALDQVMQQRHRVIPAGRFGTSQAFGTF